VIVDGRQAFSLISQQLHPGERIIWHGTPTPLIAAREQAFQLVFMTIWTGAVLFGLWNLVVGPKANSSAPFPALLVLGVMITVGTTSWIRTLRSFTACWNTAYGLTDRRIIIAVGEGATQSFTAAALGNLSRTGSKKRGSLTFGSSAYPDYGRPFRWFGLGNGLYGISDPVRVEALVYQTLIMPQREGAAA
jgi:hypothetical protein